MKNLIFVVLLLTVGVAIGVFLDRYQASSTGEDIDPAETALMHAKKHLDPEYVCPMHSQIVSDEKGSCPICGMDLVEIKPSGSDDADDPYPVVRVSSTMINNMGVRVAQVERKTLIRQIETPGFITQVRKLNFSRYKAPAKGKIIKFHFKKGQWLEKGAPLVDIALDDLVLVQEKHLELLAEEAEKNKALVDKVITSTDTSNNSDADSVSDDSKEKPVEDSAVAETNEKPAGPTIEKTRLLMKASGMTEEQIASLEETKATSPVVTLYATNAGEVDRLNVKEGEEVKANVFLFSLSGLMRVTVLANAFQRDASWVKPGQDVDIILPHDSGKPWKGKVNSGAVSININSQNIGVELVFDAPYDVVKSGMYVVGHIYGQVQENTLTLPRESIIYSRGEKRVIVALGEGRFKPVIVKTGISNDDEVEILEGVEEGDTVVVSAQFLIDSESNLQSSYRRMTAIEQ